MLIVVLGGGKSEGSLNQVESQNQTQTSRRYFIFYLRNELSSLNI